MASNRLPLTALCLATSTLFASCATKLPPPAPPQVPVAKSLREPCPRPDLPSLPQSLPPTLEEVIEELVRPVMTFSIRQEAALSVCEARKDAAIAVIDATNKIATDSARPPRPWWKLWGH